MENDAQPGPSSAAIAAAAALAARRQHNYERRERHGMANKQRAGASNAHSNLSRNTGVQEVSQWPADWWMSDGDSSDTDAAVAAGIEDDLLVDAHRATHHVAASAPARQPSHQGSAQQPEQCGHEAPSTELEDLDNPQELYDAKADQDDEVWAATVRGGRSSDAILSCPGCFTELCVDCQRHEQHANQYRAIFVMGGTVEIAEQSEELSQSSSGVRARGKRRKMRPVDTSEQVWPVACAACGTRVGVLDADEVYHFLNVLASEA